MKRNKCYFLRDTVDYLGHRIDAKGIRPLPEKIEAILKAPLQHHQDKSLGDLVTTLKKHFEPEPLVIAERFCLHQCSQNIGDTVTEYVAELRRLATHCQYGVHLEEALRDRLVCGIRNVRTQKKLRAIVRHYLLRKAKSGKYTSKSCDCAGGCSLHHLHYFCPLGVGIHHYQE